MSRWKKKLSVALTLVLATVLTALEDFENACVGYGTQEARLASVIASLQQLPGRRLFQYRGEDAQLRHVTAQDVNVFLHPVDDQGDATQLPNHFAGMRWVIHLHVQPQ